ncbi:MAG: three-Cys-motif partner protein TcmP [Planctomycetota bacterium]
MISLEDYAGREQAYVKHVFLANYLERLIHKTASTYNHIAYVDGFAGPWQSANEQYGDTSFGIALAALRSAKASWRKLGRDVRMSAHLVERDPKAYARLQEFAAKFPDLDIKTYNLDFVDAAESIVKAIPAQAFAFFFIDPKGWRIRIQSIATMLSRPNSEVVFNFMFDFINRAASMQDPKIAQGLDELITQGDWRKKLLLLGEAERSDSTSDIRKSVLISGFSETLSKVGQYPFVAETEVLRPLRDRTLYYLMYATRHPIGVEVFRDCQVEALRRQSSARAGVKLQTTQRETGQSELFSLHEMSPDKTEKFLADEKAAAVSELLARVPLAPDFVRYGDVQMAALTRHVVRATDLNAAAAELYRQGRLVFPDWTPRKKIPDVEYRVQRRTADLF